MENAKHTPGPWHVGDRNMLLGTYIRDENGFCVAVANTPNNERARYIDEAANSRLIAAAPELLAALEAMTAAFDWQAPNANPAINTAVEAARTAIANALGQTD